MIKMTLSILQQLAADTYHTVGNKISDLIQSSDPVSATHLETLMNRLHALCFVPTMDEWDHVYDSFLREMNTVWDDVHEFTQSPMVSYTLVRFILNIHTHY